MKYIYIIKKAKQNKANDFVSIQLPTLIYWKKKKKANLKELLTVKTYFQKLYFEIEEEAFNKISIALWCIFHYLKSLI